MKDIRNGRGISPIIATLLLILIAIAAGVIVYAYVVGFIGSSTTNSGGTTDTLSIDQLAVSSKATSTSPVTVFVRNLGPTTENFNTGFYLKSASSNSLLAIAVSLKDSATGETVTKVALGAGATSNLLHVAITFGTCNSGTVTVTALGATGVPFTCTAATTVIHDLTISGFTITNSTTEGALGGWSDATGAPIGTANPAVVGVAVTSGAYISLAINAVGQLTLTAPSTNTTAPATLALTAGSTYTAQVTGTDGASTTASAKAN